MKPKNDFTTNEGSLCYVAQRTQNLGIHSEIVQCPEHDNQHVPKIFRGIESWD